MLKNFGVDRVKDELQKRIFSYTDKRLHYCVITDDKIKSMSATDNNCVRGFQGYVCCCPSTAILDFDADTKQWSVNEENKNGFIAKLSKGTRKITDGFRILHNHSNAAILVLFECQPLFTNLRHDQLAINTLIEFNQKIVI